MRRDLTSCGAALAVALLSAAATADEPETVRPTDGVIRLFNGENLDGFHTWMAATGYEDPRQVFTVVDGMLRVSGDGLGYLATDKAYRDYHLVAEFKWGDETFKPREDRARDSGILVHAVGPDGSAGNWMASIEVQVIEGGTGDFIVIGGKYADESTIPTSLTCEVTSDRDGETVWRQGGERKTITGGRVNWYGRDPDWQDVLGFRGQRDVEHVPGEWNRVEVIADGGHLRNYVNGVLVNEGFEAFPSAGKILVQTEGAELFVRKLELHPLESPKDSE